MAIFDINGNELNAVYAVDGTELSSAYDIDGSEIWSDDYDYYSLSAMTFNVQSFNGINAQTDMLQAISETYNADIVGLQECPSSMSGTPEYLIGDYTYGERGLNNGGSYNWLYTNTQLTNITNDRYTNQDSYVNRSYTIGYLPFHGVNICIVNTHLAVGAADSTTIRRLQMQELYNLVNAEQYCILIGDFNQYSNTTASGDWQAMYKPFSDDGWHLGNFKDDNNIQWTYSPKNTASSLADTSAFYAPNAPDNIITSPDILITRPVFDATKLSYLNGSTIDHIPMVCELSVRIANE